MTTETLTAPRTWPTEADNTYIDRTLDGIEPQRDVLLIDGIAGANAEHAGRAFGRIQELGTFALHGVDIREPEKTPHDVFYNVATEEGKLEVEELIESGRVRAVYISRIPQDHEVLLEKYLALVEANKIDFLVMPKPAVETPEQARRVDVMVERARTALRERGLTHEPLVVHEHYLMKGPVPEIIAKIGDLTETLGRLTDITIAIQEEKTIEDEGRQKALAGGAMEDLAIHELSILERLQSALAESSATQEIIPNFTVPKGRHDETKEERRARLARYSAKRREATLTARTDLFRYGGTEIPTGKETGFIIQLGAQIDDHVTGEKHPLSITLSGGKGIKNPENADEGLERKDLPKMMALTFVHPETGVVSEIVADLSSVNAIVALPAAAAHLFPRTDFEDNGYDASVAKGMEYPDEYYQSWAAAVRASRGLYAIQHIDRDREPLIYETPTDGKSTTLAELALAASKLRRVEHL